MSQLASILVVGSINTDLVIRSPRLPAPGETVLEGEFYQAAGGKGANQAVAAARASLAPVAFVGAVGDDAFGRASLAALRQENLLCEHLRVIAGQPSGVALILVDGQGQNLISVASGANACLTPADIQTLPDSAFAGARVFLASLETPLETVREGLRRARGAGLTTILNPAPAPAGGLPDDLLALVDVLTPNETEAWQLAQPAAPIPPRAAALQLQSRGCRAVVVTLGAAGCLVVDHDVFAVPGRPVQAVDATAAGDAFNGALAAALSEGRPLVESARWAGVAASLSVIRKGAQPSLAHRAEIERCWREKLEMT